MTTVLVCATDAADPRVAPYPEAAARRGLAAHVVTSRDDTLPDGTRVGGVVAVGAAAAPLAAEMARRHGVSWHDPEAVARAGDRLHLLGRLTATGMSVPRFAAVDAATGDGLERLSGLRTPWTVTALPGGRVALAHGPDDLQALAASWRADAPAEAERLVVEAAWRGPSWLVVGLLDAGALRVVGVVDVDVDAADARTPQPAEGISVLSTPSTLERGAQAHLAGLVAHGCLALGLTQGPVLARAVTVEGRACLVDVAPGSLDIPASTVLAITGPSLEPLTLADLVVRHAVGDGLDAYGMDGSFRHVQITRPDPTIPQSRDLTPQRRRRET